MNKADQFLENVKNILVLSEVIKKYDRQNISDNVYTFEQLDMKAISLGYTGWKDERYIGTLKESTGEFERYNKSNGHVIVDNRNQLVYWSYGYSGLMLFDQLTAR